MFILIAYDVSTVDRLGQKRLRRVARACEDYGVRVQKSLFECQVGKTEWAVLRNRLLKEIDPKQDSLRFYYLDEDTNNETEHHGVMEPLNLNATSHIVACAKVEQRSFSRCFRAVRKHLHSQQVAKSLWTIKRELIDHYLTESRICLYNLLKIRWLQQPASPLASARGAD